MNHPSEFVVPIVKDKALNARRGGALRIVVMALVVIVAVAGLVLIFGMSTIREITGTDAARAAESRHQQQAAQRAEEAIAQRQSMTVAKYEQLTMGMNYPAVVLAVGSEGKESNRYVDAGGAVVVTYTWDGPKGGMAVLTFTNQVLTLKANSGLE